MQRSREFIEGQIAALGALYGRVSGGGEAPWLDLKHINADIDKYRRELIAAQPDPAPSWEAERAELINEINLLRCGSGTRGLEGE